MTETAAKKDIQKLQRAIVDALEDVKAQEIQVFDTEHLSSLFERVIIASGTSNRQTKALAASVRDKVRKVHQTKGVNRLPCKDILDRRGFKSAATLFIKIAVTLGPTGHVEF